MDHNAELRDLPLQSAPVPDKEPWATSRRPIEAAVDHPGDPQGALVGRAVYLSQCHGWIWYDSLDRFSLQRGVVWDTVEDIHNPEGANQWLSRYLENAGASVYTVKERDLQREMAIADNDGDGYSETGGGFADGEAGFRDDGSWAYGDNPFENGSTRRFAADSGSVATWIPDVPTDGEYALYVSWDSASDNARHAHYRITHPGGTIDRHFDQTVHGSTWQYVETLWLPAGVDGLTVELVADENESGRFLSADAVRIGGGMGVIERHGETTGRPRWEEGAILGTQFNGAPESVYDPYDDGNGSDPTARARWADWEHPTGEDALYLSWHSNACDECDARGTVVYTYDGTCSAGAAVSGSVDFAEALDEEIVDAAQTLWDSSWVDRGLNTDCFSEVNPSHNDETPAALVELGFHDTEVETEFLKHPEFRRDVSRAMYHAIVRYWADRDGVDPIYLPEPPVGLALRNTAGGLRLEWQPGVVGEPFGDAADDYLVFTSTDGRSWDNGLAVNGTSTILDARPGQTIYARVAARNDGGSSFPSDVMAARRSPDGTAPVLVVAAFDRLDRGQLEFESLPGVGDAVKMDLLRMNAYDIVVPTAESIDALGWPFDSVSDERFLDQDLDAIRLVIWQTGEESTADETFSTGQQSALAEFVNQGGALFTSGAEILWDLDERGTASDQEFATEILGASLADDDAGTTRASGVGLLDGIDMDFTESSYPVEFPDVLDPQGEPIAEYSTGGVAAAQFGDVVIFGFPFEGIASRADRDAIIAELLPELVPGYVPPDGQDTGDTDVEISDTDTDAEDSGDTDGRHRLDRKCGCATPPTGTVGGALLVVLMGATWSRRRR